MSDSPADQSGRMLASDATDFERRVLEAARQRKPSAAASARMAKALGLSAAAVGAAAAATTARAAEAVAAKATVAGTTAVWPWVSAGVIGLAVAGVVIGTRATRETPPARPAVTAPAPAVEPTPPVQAPSSVKSAPAVAAGVRPRAAARPADLGAEVALIDAARDAIAAGEGRRALEIVHRYQERYPNGTFRPEVGAIKIEALMKLGRDAEARALAERFVAEHRGSLLARRVADVAGLGAR